MAKILLNKENLFFNLEEISKKTGGKEKIAVVLKDNAYGHGIVEIAKMAKEFGVGKAVVRTIEEANKIKDIFDYIIVLSQKDIHSYSHSFHIALNSMEYIDKMPENSNVHIAIDAGMHRQGILPEELEEAFKGLLARNINITGVFTHHKGADALSCEYFCQKQVFNSLKQDVKKICEKLNIPVPSFHSCSSPALFRCENFEDDFARIGLATYGYLDDAEVYEFPKLKPVMSLWASRFSTRVLKEKQAVGYGGGYVADKDMVISTYDIGYGDGLFRLTEKDEYVTPKGYKILGRMSMDSLSLNSEDDEVCIFNNATDLAKLHNTIIYEILVSLKENIERVLE